MVVYTVLSLFSVMRICTCSVYAPMSMYLPVTSMILLHMAQ